MAEYLKIAGVTGNSFSIGIRTNKSTFTVNGTNIQIDKILDMNTHKIINVTDPTADQDAMTKKYADDNYINLSQKGANNGVATLDANGKVPVTQLPSSIMEYKGAWNANTNTPTLEDGMVGADNGDVYRVSVAGTQDLGSGNITFYVGDFVIYNGTIWQRSPGTDITGKMDLVASPTNGNVLTTDATGQAIDSGIAASDLVVTNDLDAYMLLAATPTNGNILTTDATGQATDSGTAISDLMTLAATPTNGNVLTTDATGQAVDSGTALSDLTGKMELVATPTNGNLVTTDATGQATDSGIAADDIMLLAATPTNGNILTTDATGQATDSGTAIDDVMLLIATPTNGNVVTTDANGQATDSGTALSDLATTDDIVGVSRTIKITVGTTNTASTFALPNGATVQNVAVRVGTAYTAGGTIAVSCGAVSLLGTADNDAQTTGLYVNSDIVDIATGAVISVVIAGTPVSGASDVFVTFISSAIA